MILGRTFHRLLTHAVRRRERAERLAAAITRRTSRSVRIGDRYANYASGSEWALLGRLGELHHQAETVRRSLAAAAANGLRRDPRALRGLRAAYDHAAERAHTDERLRRELLRIGRYLGRLEVVLAPPSPTNRRPAPGGRALSWGAQPAAATATTDPPNRRG